ncbi:MAG: DUF5712 family protein [Bacteroidia bacterium]
MANLYKIHTTVTENDQLVWAAIIHQNRIYTETDIKRAKEGIGKIKLEDIKLGQMKKGDNTHIHIVLSARDATQKKTITLLTPKNKTSRNFELKSFQRDNQRLFQKMFNYRIGEKLYENRQIKFIEKNIEEFDKKHYRTYDINDIKKSGNKMDWSSRFSINLSNMFRELIFEKKIVLQPTIYMEEGRKYYNEKYPHDKVSTSAVKNRHVFKDYTSSYQNSATLTQAICSLLEMEGKRQETKGYDFVKKPKKKLEIKHKRSLGGGFSRGM